MFTDTLGSDDRVLRLPYRGSPQTVSVIKTAALAAQNDYTVRQLTEEICRGIRSKDYLSEALAINYYVWANVRYMRDPRTIELVKAPHVVARELLAGKTPNLDCDDMTCLVCALLLASGCQCAAVTVAFKNMFYKGQRQFSHVFALAYEPRSGAKLVLDPVANVNTKQMLGRVVAAKVWPVA